MRIYEGIFSQPQARVSWFLNVLYKPTALIYGSPYRLPLMFFAAQSPSTLQDWRTPLRDNLKTHQGWQYLPASALIAHAVGTNRSFM